MWNVVRRAPSVALMQHCWDCRHSFWEQPRQARLPKVHQVCCSEQTAARSVSFGSLLQLLLQFSRCTCLRSRQASAALGHAAGLVPEIASAQTARAMPAQLQKLHTSAAKAQAVGASCPFGPSGPGSPRLSLGKAARIPQPLKQLLSSVLLLLLDLSLQLTCLLLYRPSPPAWMQPPAHCGNRCLIPKPACQK